MRTKPAAKPGFSVVPPSRTVDPAVPGSASTKAVSEQVPQSDTTALRVRKIAVDSENPIARATVYVRGTMHCTGTLITQRHVLTAYHCVSEPRLPVIVVLWRGFPGKEQTLTIAPKDIRRHPKARFIEAIDMYENDVAVLTLPEDAPAEAHPVRIAKANELSTGDEVILAGYGGDRTVGMGIQRTLRMTISKVIALDDKLANTIRYRSVGGAENAGCMGDSGGPMFKQLADGSLLLVGIRWGGDTPDMNQACRDWGLDGDARDYVKWIRDAIRPIALPK